MAITLDNKNLYPPLVPDILPAFLYNKDDTVRLYFNLSPYNKLQDISAIQVHIIKQIDNKLAFRKQRYPSGIKIYNVSEIDTSKTYGDYKYSILIPQNDINLFKGVFALNQYYKVQFRFVSSTVSPFQQFTDADEDSTAASRTEDYLQNSNNQSAFSEWSRICLIRSISESRLTLLNFSSNNKNTFSTSLLNIIGTVRFTSVVQEQYVKSFNIKIYETDTQKLVEDSGQIFTNPYAPNEINYTLKYALEDGNTYNMTVTYTTINLYSNTIIYNFNIITYGTDNLPANITATPDNDNGRIKVLIQSKNEQHFMGTFTIRRTSSKSNYHIWEDVANISYNTSKTINETWYDYTIESGVMYKYGAQKRYPNDNRGTIIITNTPIMCLFDDVFLNDGQRQLKLKFNTTISDFKYNVTEAQQMAIGAKYPYIKRNSQNYYRTFTINGLISSFMDQTNWYFGESDLDSHNYSILKSNDNLFTNKLEIYQDAKNDYDNFNHINNISNEQDYIYEKNFRDKVYDFLYKHNVKLFRSTTEGNILIKLMNITFQPNETLGRKLYSFSATAVQVDESNISNYKKYDILAIDKYIADDEAIYPQTYIGVLEINNLTSDTVIIQNDSSSELKTLYQNITPNYITTLNNLQSCIITINADPIPLPNENPQFLGYEITLNDNNHFYIQAQSASTLENQKENKYYGYLELTGLNTNITKLILHGTSQNPITAKIQYELNAEQTQIKNLFPSNTQYIYNPSQEYDIFKIKEPIVQNIIAPKYLKIETNKITQELIGISELSIDTSNNAVVYIKDIYDTHFNRHILPEGYIYFNEKDTNDSSLIKELYFDGIHMSEKQNSNFLNETEFYKQTINNSRSFSPNELLQQENIEHKQNYCYELNNFCLKASLNPLNHKLTLTNPVQSQNDIIQQDIETGKSKLIILQDNIKIRYVLHNGKYYYLNNNNDIQYPTAALITYCYCIVEREYNS